MTKIGKPEPIQRPVAAAERTLSILDAFATYQRSLTLGELAETTGLFKSVILRYMIPFERMSYVQKLPDGRYQLGTKAMQLGRAFERSLDQREVIETAMARLRDATGESVFFYVREGDSRMCLMGLDSPRSLRVSRKLGVRIPMDSTSISQILRDYAAGAPAGVFFDASMVRATVGAYDELTSSISAPTFGRSGQLVGALAVSGPVGRFDANDPAITGLVATQARLLSRTLGFDPEPPTNPA